MSLSRDNIIALLNEKADKYNNPWFIEDDPVSIPHFFSDQGDREIAGFLSASIAWGQRPVIIRNAMQLMKWMDYSPLDFVLHASEQDIKYFGKFNHRTFNGEDCIYFLQSLQRIYREEGGLEAVFTRAWKDAEGDAGLAIHIFRDKFLFEDPGRTSKHIADPLKQSAAKRINMYLRWMVRQDEAGVDFGLWKKIPMSELCCPLDIHSGNVARVLGLLHRKQNDWKAVAELTSYLKEIDPADPVRFDYALFGMGLYEGLRK